MRHNGDVKRMKEQGQAEAARGELTGTWRGTAVQVGKVAKGMVGHREVGRTVRMER